MALTAAQVTQAWRAMLDANGAQALPTKFTKPDLKAAVEAADAWADSVAAAYNAALPVAFRTNATAAEKGLLLAYVCLKRAGL
jgi:hypothetical protein